MRLPEKIFFYITISFILTVFIFNSSINAATKEEPIENNFEVHLITIEPGIQIYDSYGHSALRFINYSKNIDLFFDYGRFRFDNTFIFGYMTGNARYWLGGSYTYKKLKRAAREGRAVFSQKLNISSEDAQQLMKDLEKKMRTRQKYYLYDPLHDNCTTRLRDIINRYSTNQLKTLTEPVLTESTHRKLSDELIYENPFHWFAINLIFNGKADKPLNLYQKLFLPQTLMNTLEELRQSKKLNITEPVKKLQPGKGYNSDQSIDRRAQDYYYVSSILLLVALFLFYTGFSAPGGMAVRTAFYFLLIFYSLFSGFAGFFLSTLQLSRLDAYSGNLNLFAFHPVMAGFGLAVHLYVSRTNDIYRKVSVIFIALPFVGLLLALTFRFSALPFQVIALIANSLFLYAASGLKRASAREI